MSVADEFSKHEVVDRAHVCQEMFNLMVAEHSLVEKDPELAEEAAKVTEALGNFYQYVGNKFI
jgi:mannitol-1-phosphate/altronate dehydrogenase